MEMITTEKGETFYNVTIDPESSHKSEMMVALTNVKNNAGVHKTGICFHSQSDEEDVFVTISPDEALNLARALCDLAGSGKTITTFVNEAMRPLTDFKKDCDSHIDTLNEASDTIIGLRDDQAVSDLALLNLLGDIKWLKEELRKILG